MCSEVARFEVDKPTGNRYHIIFSVYCYKWGEVARFEVQKPTGNCYDITWTTDHLNIIEDCFDIEGKFVSIFSPLKTKHPNIKN